MLSWPWKRFEKFYEAFAKRQVADELTKRKLMTIAAFYANSNYDSAEVKREEIIRSVEKQYQNLIDTVYAPAIDIGSLADPEEAAALQSGLFTAINVDGDHLMEEDTAAHGLMEGIEA